MEETEEERLDREFDELNEGIIATQILEGFEKRYPDPLGDDYLIEVDIDNLDDIWAPEAAEEALEDWSDKAAIYAQGWKDALAALEWRAQMEKDYKWVHYILDWFEKNPITTLWWRAYGYMPGLQELLPVDVDEEDVEEWMNGTGAR